MAGDCAWTRHLPRLAAGGFGLGRMRRHRAFARHGCGAFWAYRRRVDSAAVLALYDATMRRDPVAAEGVRFERVGPVVRSVGLWNIVLAWELADLDAAALAIAEQAEYARATGLQLEWKLFAHDRPAGLASVLERAGFVADESETLMVLDLERGVLADGAPDGLEIRRVVDAAGVDDLVGITSAVFGADKGSRASVYVRLLDDPAVAFFVAYCGEQPVAAGRLNLPAGRIFASMWGGSTLAEYRSRGIYRALVARRADEARRHGYRYITTDARETSRPILERIGFVALTGITGWVLRP